MPRLKNLPSLDIIKGFKGVIDYAIYRGVPSARAWPRTPRSHLSAATLTSAALFGEIVSAYHLQGGEVIEAYREMAEGTPLTSRDLFVRGVLGYLYEIDMADLAALLEQIRDAIIALNPILNPLGSINTDDYQVDVKTSGLPTGAASETTLASRALESGGNLAAISSKLDVALSTRALETGGNLASILSKLDVALSTRALESGGNLASILSKLDVALSTRALESGGNLEDTRDYIAILLDTYINKAKPFGYYDRYAEEIKNLNASAGWNDLAGSIVPAGEIWLITAIAGTNTLRAIPIQLGARYPGSLDVYCISQTSAGAYIWVAQAPELVLKPGDRAIGSFGNCVAGDDIYLRISGYKMQIA